MTAALDGERNLKPKKSPLFVAQNFSLLFSSARQYQLVLNTTAPQKDLVKFKGKLTVT